MSLTSIEITMSKSRIHSDYGQALDADIVRLRMEVNMQQKNLFEQINLAKFKAKQAAQERDLAKNDLERLIQSVKNRTNRFVNHEKPLKDLQNIPAKRLGSERNYGNGSSHSRRNLDTYQKLYFNDFKIPSSNQFIHNDNDPFNINIETPSQPKIYHSGQPSQLYGYGGSLKSTSQAIGMEIQNRNPAITKPRPDPLSYGMKEFENESSYAMNQIGKHSHLIL